MWNQESALSKSKKDLVVARWNIREPPTLNNIVLLTRKEMQAHYPNNGDAAGAMDKYDPQIVKLIQDKLESIKY